MGSCLPGNKQTMRSEYATPYSNGNGAHVENVVEETTEPTEYNCQAPPGEGGEADWTTLKQPKGFPVGNLAQALEAKGKMRVETGQTEAGHSNCPVF